LYRRLDRAEGAVLDPEAAVIEQEHDPVRRREFPLAAHAREVSPLSQLAEVPALVPHARVQIAHVLVGVREDQRAVSLAALDIISGDRRSRFLAAPQEFHLAARGIGGDAGRDLATRQGLARFARPIFALPAHCGDLGDPGPLGDGAERRPRLDCELPRRRDVFDRSVEPSGRSFRRLDPSVAGLCAALRSR
jgi:hypothetical protein